MLSSFFLSHILCILLPAYLCYALQPLYNYIFLVQLCSLCKCSSYTDVYLYLSAFPDSQLFFVTVAPFPSGRCRRKSMLTGFCCDTIPVVQASLILPTQVILYILLSYSLYSYFYNGTRNVLHFRILHTLQHLICHLKT